MEIVLRFVNEYIRMVYEMFFVIGNKKIVFVLVINYCEVIINFDV